MLADALSVFGLGDEAMHILLVAFSLVVLVLSVLAYARRRELRYLLLTLAFLFLTLSQTTTMIETVFLSNALIITPVIGLHLTHLFDFVMLLCFVTALVAR